MTAPCELVPTTPCPFSQGECLTQKRVLCWIKGQQPHHLISRENPEPQDLPYPDTGGFSGDFSPSASVAAFSCSFNLLTSQSAFALTMLSSV